MNTYWIMLVAGLIIGAVIGYCTVRLSTLPEDPTPITPPVPSVEEIIVVLENILRSVQYSPFEKACIEHNIKILTKLKEMVEEHEEEEASE